VLRRLESGRSCLGKGRTGTRQLSHYQFSWVAGEPGTPGTWTLQLVLDQGAWEEVLTIDAADADNLQDLLATAGTVNFDVKRRTLLFGTTPVGHH
jgi:hypothetical protein